MAYDALGNYVPDDEEASLDQMRLALGRRDESPLASQIPGYGKPVPKAERPLDHVPRTFGAIAANYNPLMMQLSLRDMAKTAVINPLLQPASVVAEAAMGEKPTGTKFYQAPQTHLGREFEEGLGKAMDVAKVPSMWPLSPTPHGMRPAITPNDVRVMGAEATRVGRQVRDIPTDFSNAQSGFQRLDPVTNEPTYGAKLQGVAQDIGDITAARTAEGKSLIPGIPSALTPDTNLYAVRPKGSRLIAPTRTSSDPNFQYPKDPTGALLRNEFAEPYSTDVKPTELVGIAEKLQTNDPNAQQTARAFEDYYSARIQQMFPDAPDAWNAREAFNSKYADKESKAQMHLGIMDDFLVQTPEGQTSGMPVSPVLKERHLAAMKWLTGPYANYIERNVGTEGDPLVKLASQGLTMLPTDVIKDVRGDRFSDAESNRTKGGYPIGGSFEKLIDNKERELRNTRNELRELETRRSELAIAAEAQGLADPAQLPDYAALTNPIRAKAAARDKLQKEVDNLQLGAMYEDITDAAAYPTTAAKAKGNVDYPSRQFYPTLSQTPDAALVYQGSPNVLREAGFDKIANTFYDDVMSGKIPIDKVEKTTVENFVRGKSQERIKLEAENKVKEAQYIATAEDNLRAVLRRDVPNNMTFGNAAVIELNKSTPQDVAIARVSEDTAVLDHCVGQGGSAANNKINIFTGKRQSYEPIIDPITGQRNPNAGNQITAYVRGLYEGNELASVRSLETGRPVATIQFETSHLGADGQQRYRIGYASGFSNGEVDPVYAPAIRDYLNSRADSIASIGNNLTDHTGIYDTTAPANLKSLARKAGLSMEQMSLIFDDLPRFALPEDITKAWGDASDTAIAPTSAVAVRAETPIVRPNDTVALRDSMDAALSNAIDFVDTDRLGDALRSVVQGRIGEFLEGVRAEDLHDALLNFREALWNDEATFANGFSEFNNALGEGLSQYLNDLDGIIDFNERRAREREAPVAAPVDPLANLFDDLEPEPNHPANLPAPIQAPAIDFPSILDRTLHNLSQNEGVNISERVETVAARVAEDINPRLDPRGFANALRETANAERLERVEFALYDLADQIETAVARQTPTSQLYANELLDMGRNPDGTINRPDLLGTAHALANGELDHPAFRHIPPGPERAEAMAPVWQHFNSLVAAEFQRPAPEATLQQMTRQELIQNIEPDRWMVINDRADRATIVARGFGDPAVYVGYIRQGDAAITEGLNMYEREIVARDVSDASQFINNALQAPAPAEQPANIADRFPIPTDVRNASTPALANHITPADEGDVVALFDTLTSVNDREDLPRIVHLIRNHRIGEWEGFDDAQREILARLVDEHYENAPRPAAITQADHTLYDEFNGIVREAIDNDLLDPNGYTNQDLAELVRNNEIGGLDDLTDAQRTRLAQMVREYGYDGVLPNGHANGGPVRGYRKGGAVRAKNTSYKQIPNQAFIKMANGGTVTRMPSLDEMRYHLMMQR